MDSPLERWTSHDAALQGFDSKHIALLIGDGTADEANRLMVLLPQLRIEKAGVVRALARRAQSHFGAV